MLTFLGTPDMITVLFFSVSWQTVYYETVNALSFLSPINSLLPLTDVQGGQMILLPSPFRSTMINVCTDGKM